MRSLSLINEEIMTILRMNKNTLCNDNRKDCNILASRLPSLAIMHTVICREHIEVISFEEEEDES